MFSGCKVMCAGDKTRMPESVNRCITFIVTVEGNAFIFPSVLIDQSLSLVRIFCVVMIRRERIEETIYRLDGLLLFVCRRCLRGLPCNTLVDPSILFLKPSKFHCVLSTNCISSCNFYSRSLPLFQFSVPETSTQAFAFVHFIV